ncbi:VOC family protein [Daejeonella lutea]|uniref:Uncharacterized conserved protein PhnB, glyoxalase superfamily n=1 Tax=Daejeonella lutea TaxID=572036 RepID=A0A1T5AIW6_9SPHI|nr:glyoxalase [Daejeonella lutea]SKB34951.1 Uncharacterized conserved protein PhnB, glyoxalase superfamily [Daejeonella lutea]
MLFDNRDKLTGGIFITFAGNCRKALTFYQGCFGGTLEFETFDQPLKGFTEKPVISGLLVSENLVIHGSDLVHDEGRRIGNYLSVFLPCKSADDRRVIAGKLRGAFGAYNEDERLIEVVDRFEVRWVLGITN